MPEQQITRRLAAVLAADVAGYSRMMAADEASTIAAMRQIWNETFNPAVAARRGRIVKMMGDGALVEFGSVVDAVECAVAIQRAMGERNLAAKRPVEFRIGINLGDIVIDGDDIFGDGVNVAARLEPLAEPNGISISGAVYEQVRGKLQIPFTDMGEQSLKNIAQPVRIYHALPLAEPGSWDLTQAERAFREEIKKRFGEDAAFYVPLSGSTTDGFPVRREQAGRSARRFGRRARVEYNELIPAGETIKQVRIDDLRAAATKYPCIVLLGDPGCGKSTAIEALAYGCAGTGDRLPVVLQLSELLMGTSIKDFIKQGWGGATASGHWGAPSLAANLEAYLEEGKLLLLFDALNEMPQDGYRERCRSLRAFLDEWSPKGNCFVVTCRVLDYGDELAGLQRVEVQPLSDHQIREFLQNELLEKWEGLWRALRNDDGSQRLIEMARNPYLLTVMIDVFEEDGELRQNRAELMGRFIEIMLEWAKAKCPSDKWLDASLQVESLALMAFEMQARSGFGTRVRTEQIKAVMPSQIQLDLRWPAESTPPDQVLSLAAAANIIEMPVDHSSARFYHQLLQEYFAARQMLKLQATGLAEFWRSPLLEIEMPAWSRPENNYEPMPPPPTTGWEETTILAAGMAADESDFVQAVLAVNPVLAGRCLLALREESGSRQAVVSALLAAIKSKNVALRVRVAAGRVLGALGDPRLGEMVTIPAGMFLMGEGTEQHMVSLPEFSIGKYPVANAEYRRFLEAGGYEKKRWWTEAGWVEIGEKQSEPRFWQDSRFNHPNQPVMGLSWYECVAFCRWLSVDTGQTWRLPTEAEWEKAARGTDGRIFPWGNEYDPERLNGRGPRDRQVCTSTPVGLYSTGVSPFGLFDCTGNVWEWCATRWKKAYPYDLGSNEWELNYLEGQNLRVLRGGSWYDTADVTRCTHRFKFQPYGWNDRGGFRLVTAA